MAKQQTGAFGGGRNQETIRQLREKLSYHHTLLMAMIDYTGLDEKQLREVVEKYVLRQNAGILDKLPDSSE